MINKALVLFLAALACRSSCGQVVPHDSLDSSVVIEFVVTDSFGMSLRGAQVTVKNANIRKTLNVEGTRAIITLPQGEYTIEANRAGFRTIVRPLKTEGETMTVLLAFEIAEIEVIEGDRWVKGKVPERPDGGKCRYVRLIPAYTDRRALTARLSDDGAFAVLGLSNGKYFAVVFGDQGVCSLSEFEVPLLLSTETEVRIGRNLLERVRK